MGPSIRVWTTRPNARIQEILAAIEEVPNEDLQAGKVHFRNARKAI
jgi:hypothetical protein